MKKRTVRNVPQTSEVVVVNHLEEPCDRLQDTATLAIVCDYSFLKPNPTLEQTIVTFLVSFRIWIPFC